MKGTTTVKLDFPIEIDGKTISEVKVRRPKGKDMVALGDHFQAVARFEQAGENAVPDAATFKTMVMIAAQLADLGEEAAGELDMVDLVSISNAAFQHLGKLPGRGEQKSGERQ